MAGPAQKPVRGTRGGTDAPAPAASPERGLAIRKADREEG